MTESIPPRSANAQSAADLFFSDIDDALASDRTDVDSIRTMIAERARQTQWRREWSVVKAVWALGLAHPWIQQAHVHWNDASDQGEVVVGSSRSLFDSALLGQLIAARNADQIPPDHPASATLLRIARQLARLPKSNPIESGVAYAAWNDFDDAIGRFEWLNEDSNWWMRMADQSHTHSVIRFGSQDEVARSLLRDESLAAWEAMSLRRELKTQFAADSSEATPGAASSGFSRRI